VQLVVDAKASAASANATTVRGRVANAPSGAEVVVLHKVGRGWKRLAQTSVRGSAAWSARVSLPEGVSRLRVEVRLRSRVLATSSSWRVSVPSRPVVAVRAPASVSTRAQFTLAGTVSNAPPGSTVQRQLQVGGRWQPRGAAVPVKKGGWNINVTAPRNRGTLTYQIVLLSGSKEVARSSAVIIRVK